MATVITTEGAQAYAPCLFKIERTTSATTDAEVRVVPLDTNTQYQYYKTIKGLSAQVNVADYARAYLRTAPYVSDATFDSDNGNALGRAVRVRVTADGVSANVAISEGWDNSAPLLRTNLRKRLIGVGMTDEIEVRSNTAATIRVYAKGALVAEESQRANIAYTSVAYAVCVPSGLKAGDTFYLTVNSERIDYTVVASGTQLRWINRYGAVDSWVWESEQSEEVSTTKTRIYTADGYTTLNTEAEEEVTLRSRVVDKDTAREVASVLYALRVWRVDFADDWGAVEQVDVANTEGTVSNADNLTQIGVRIRRRKRVL